MKFIQTLFLLIVTSFSINAQNITVKGSLLSSTDKKGLPYATISVAYDANKEKSIKKFATKEDGTFTTILSPGKYIMSFNFVGMDQVNEFIELTASNNPYDMGEVIMSETSTQLDEISVTAQKPLVRVEIDKLTYSAKDDPEASTSNVLDLLRKVPLVTVDGEDQIQLKGASNFKIYLNGKPSNMISGNPSQVLKSMPANSVKDIEVITDPGARYDAEGVGGIINIITDNRADNGYSGSVGANGDNFGGYGGNVYLATKYGKFGFTGNGGYYHHRQPESKSTFTREEFNPVNNLSQDGFSKSKGGGLFLSGNMSYEADTLNLINLSVSRFGGEFNSHSLQEALSVGARPFGYIMNGNSINRFGGMNFSADYQRSFKRKGELFTLSYRYEKNPNDSEFESVYDVDEETDFFIYPDGHRIKSINDAGGDEHTFQADYVNPLDNKHSLEAGLKYILRENSSRGEHTFLDVTDNTWKPDIDRKNDLDHSQKIYSGYAGYGYKMNKFGMKLGLRGELTNQKINFMSNNDAIVNTNFFDLVPSITLSYQLGMTKTLRGGYNMRISRPGIWYLNPYINDLDPNNISYGNPDLNSEKQHNFNINYGSFSQKINFNGTLSYSYANNAVTTYSFIEYVDDKAVTHNTYRNIGRNHTIGTNIYLSWTPTQFIRTHLNGGINYTDIKSTEENINLHNSGFSGRTFAGLTFTLPKDFRIGTNGGLFSNRIQLQTKQSAFFFYSFSLQKSLLDKKLDISLNAQNPFSKYLEISSTTTGNEFIQKSSFLNPMRSFRLSVSYRFGDLKASMKKVQRGIINEDVMQGEGGGQQGASTTTTPTGG